MDSFLLKLSNVGESNGAIGPIETSLTIINHLDTMDERDRETDRHHWLAAPKTTFIHSIAR